MYSPPSGQQDLFFEWRFKSDPASALGIQQELGMRKADMLFDHSGEKVEMRVTLPSNLSDTKNNSKTRRLSVAYLTLTGENLKNIMLPRLKCKDSPMQNPFVADPTIIPYIPPMDRPYSR